MAGVGLHGAGERPRDQAVDRRNAPREALADLAQQREGVVLEHRLAQELAHPAAGLRRLLGVLDSRGTARCACAGRRRTRSGRLRAASSSRRAKRLLQRQRVVVAADREGRHHAEGHRGDRAQAPETDARGAPQVRVGLARALDHRAVRGHQLERLDLRRDVAEPLSRAVGRGRDRARDGLHVDVAEVLERKPLPASASLRSRITMPASTFARPASRSRSSTRFMRSSRNITPSVQAMSVNEWPDAGGPHGLPASAARRDRTCAAPRRTRAARPPRARTAGPRPSCATCAKPNRCRGTLLTRAMFCAVMRSHA